MLVRVKTSIDNKNVSAFWEELAFGIIQTGEVITTSTRLGKKFRIQGLSDVLKSPAQILEYA